MSDTRMVEFYADVPSNSPEELTKTLFEHVKIAIVENVPNSEDAVLLNVQELKWVTAALIVCYGSKNLLPV